MSTAGRNPGRFFELEAPEDTNFPWYLSCTESVSRWTYSGYPEAPNSLSQTDKGRVDRGSRRNRVRRFPAKHPQ